MNSIATWLFLVLAFPNLNPEEPIYHEFSPKDFRRYICYTTNGEMIIDGRLDERSWELADFSEEFIDIEGTKRPLPLYETKVKMLWDEEYLYIGAWLEEHHIWATYARRESVIFHENDFEIFIDPDGNTHNYYEIEINALNTVWDLLLSKPYRDGGRPITKWNVDGMKTAVYLKGTINNPEDLDEYWSVEFALPWSSLKTHAKNRRKPKNGEQWRINFSRVQWQRDIVDGRYVKRINPETGKSFPEYNWVWSPQGFINMHRPETWGFIQFSEKQIGAEKCDFQFNRDENLKWELRKIYYAQNNHKKVSGRYTDDLKLLESTQANLNGIQIDVNTIQHGFEASLYSNETRTTWKIRQDGLVWTE
ncbi:MAG: carbohydrate-binding family 9-like protein [Cytophagales bacterium]|nr:carbohydrate-binding family 9-like protein [Cytophagales bacterium]